MNICLTTACNNHCPFCFQKELHNHIEEFTLENLKKLIDWAKPDLITYGEHIQLLGGEPTMYPYLTEVIDMIHKEVDEHLPILIITNLLCDLELLQKLLQYKVEYLVNCCYDYNKKDVFERNLNLLLSTEERTLGVAASITLTRNRALNDEYISRIVDLSNRFPDLTKFRIGLEQPSPGDKWNKIYNYDYEFTRILDELGDKLINFDCSINYCQFSPNMLERLLSTSRNINWKCNNPPLDVLPNLSAKYCYSSSNDFSVDNIFKYKSLYHLKNYFIDKGVDCYILQNKKCSNCEKFLSFKCRPCHCVDQALYKGEIL